MTKIKSILSSTLLLFLVVSTDIYASVLDQMSFIPEKCDLSLYLDFNSVISFLQKKGISSGEIDELAVDSSASENEQMIKNFDIKLSEIDEILFAGNIESFEKKAGFIIFLNVKEGKGKIPEALKGKPSRIKNTVFYKVEGEDDIYFSKIESFYIIGSKDLLETFLDKRNSTKKDMPASASEFIKNSSGKSLYLRLTVSRYLKDAMDKAFMQGALVVRGLNENVFIKSLLNLQSVEYGIDIRDKLYFFAGMQGLSADDAEKLLMISHFSIVGTSLAASFSDMIAARSEDQALGEVTRNREFISSLQQILGRINSKQVGNGVLLSFYMTDKETDALIALIKKEITEEKKRRIEKRKSEKISAITKAIMENDSAKAEKLLNEKTEIDHLDLEGNSILSTAALKGNINIVTLVITRGADINLKNSDGLTPLHCAAKSGSAEVAALLIKKGALVSARGEDDMTPLHYNAAQGNAELTKILLNAGADVNALSLNGSAPVHIASAEGFLDVIKALAGKNADFTVADGDGQRGVDIAAKNNHTAIVDYFKKDYNLEPAGNEENYTEDEFIPDEESTEPDDETNGDNMN